MPHHDMLKEAFVVANGVLCRRLRSHNLVISVPLLSVVVCERKIWSKADGLEIRKWRPRSHRTVGGRR
jgi:hypothetical protein